MLCEQELPRRPIKDGQLAVYHYDFRALIDTLKDSERVKVLWKEGAPWQVWE